MIPVILTANTYYWNSGENAGTRRRNEEKRQNEVYNFFLSLGFDAKRNGNEVTGTYQNITVSFSYSESCKNVYKHFRVWKDGKISNIRTIKKMIE